MPIRVLDAATVGRIAAGEVVERPGSVVKELIENSLDAGATSITVEIRGGGIDYLRVTDNGCGIEPGQVRLAFENHATSKLQRAEQLDDIRTLGFRGEALPSIAAVSRVEMTTRAKDQPSGMRYSSEGGQNIRVQEAGCPQGTTIIMRDLFFNVPVRRAFLKKPSYEGGLVSDAAARLLLGNPNVSMRFISGGNTLYQLWRRQAAPCGIRGVWPRNGGKNGGARCGGGRRAHQRPDWRGRIGKGNARASAVLYQWPQRALPAAVARAGAGVPLAGNDRHVSDVRAESDAAADSGGCERASQ